MKLTGCTTDLRLFGQFFQTIPMHIKRSRKDDHHHVQQCVNKNDCIPFLSDAWYILASLSRAFDKSEHTKLSNKCKSKNERHESPRWDEWLIKGMMKKCVETSVPHSKVHCESFKSLGGRTYVEGLSWYVFKRCRIYVERHLFFFLIR